FGYPLFVPMGLIDHGEEGMVYQPGPGIEQEQYAQQSQAVHPLPALGMFQEVFKGDGDQGNGDYDGPLGLDPSVETRNEEKDQHPVHQIDQGRCKEVPVPEFEEGRIDPIKQQPYDDDQVQEIAQGELPKGIGLIGAFVQMEAYGHKIVLI